MRFSEWYERARSALGDFMLRMRWYGWASRLQKKKKEESRFVLDVKTKSFPVHEVFLMRSEDAYRSGNVADAMRYAYNSLEYNRADEDNFVRDKNFHDEYDAYRALVIVGKSALLRYMHSGCSDGGLALLCHETLERVTDKEAYPDCRVDAYLSLAELYVLEDRKSDAFRYWQYAAKIMKAMDRRGRGLEERLQRIEDALKG